MALVAKDSGRYIKVIRDRCIFTPGSVQVFYYEFDSKKDRDDYFARDKEVKEFLKRAHDKSIELGIEVNEVLEKVVPKEDSGLRSFVLPENIVEMFNERDQFALDLVTFEFGWDKEEPLSSDFKSINIFKSLGFKEEWLTPLKPVQISGLSTGAFTNQTFSFPCLYKELKKIFKDSFIDC